MVDIYDKEAVRAWIQELIDNGQIHQFYISQAWINVRGEVLDEYKHECHRHKARGLYRKAITAHHRQYVRKHPELALSKTYEYQGKEYMNLEPLCDECHKIEHRRNKKKKKPLTEERW